MVDYKSYKIILDYLDKEELIKLREYLESENNKYYLQEAKKEFKNYLASNHRSFYGYDDEGKLIVSNTTSMYELNSNEILSPYYRDKMKRFDKVILNSQIEMVKSLYEKYIKYEMVDVDDFSLDEDRNVTLCNEEHGITQLFKCSNFYFSKKILGEDLKYALVKTDSIPLCMATSKKGTGIILGYRKA